MRSAKMRVTMLDACQKFGIKAFLQKGIRLASNKVFQGVGHFLDACCMSKLLYLGFGSKRIRMHKPFE